MSARASRVGEGNPFWGHKHTPEWRAALSARQYKWTDADVELVKSWYTTRVSRTFNLAELARRLGRSKQVVSRFARKLGLTRSMPEILRKHPSSVHSFAKRGYRDDLGGIFFRSRWEANYARFLAMLQRQRGIVSWEFEPVTFSFEDTTHGIRSYTPDFRIVRPDGSVYFVEIKGWMDRKSAIQFKGMAKQHPTVELQLVDKTKYRQIARRFGPIIPHWEVEKIPTQRISRKNEPCLELTLESAA